MQSCATHFIWKISICTVAMAAPNVTTALQACQFVLNMAANTTTVAPAKPTHVDAVFYPIKTMGLVRYLSRTTGKYGITMAFP
jgi:hypothetical protein